MPEDPEVNLIFNAESEEAQKKLQELVAKFEGISESITRAGEKLQSFEADARDLADNAGRLDELAAKSGNAKAIKDVNAVFSAGVAAVAGYGEEVTKCTNSLMSFGAGASKALSDFKNGSISFKEAEAALERYTAFAAKSERVVDSLSKKVAKGFSELGRAAELDDALSAWGRLSETTGQARKQLAEADEAVQGQLAALAELREGLDATSESYASQELAITRQENVLKKQAAEIKGLREELLGMAMAVREAFSEKNTSKGFGGALSKLTELEKDVGAAVESTSKALSTQEVETARFAVVSQRATNAIEKEAKKEKENAYAMELAAMSKTKLAAETRKLIDERKKAAAVGDVAAYQKLTTQLGQCRTAMRGLLQQQQVNKIAMLQQAQTVAQMGGQLESVVGGIANFGKAAKAGSVNVTGLASSVMSLSMAIKAGLGPLGWVLMAVQGLQMAWNAYAQRQKRLAEARKASAKAEVDALESAYKRAEEIAERNKQRARESVEAEKEAVRAKAAIRKRDLDLEEARDSEQRDGALDVAKANAEGESRILEQQLQMGLISRQDYYAQVSKLDDELKDLALQNERERQAADEKRAQLDVQTAEEELRVARNSFEEFKQGYSDTVQKLADDAQFNEQFDHLNQGLEDIKQRNEKLRDQLNTLNKQKEAKVEWKDILKAVPDLGQYGNNLRDALVNLRMRVESGEKEYQNGIKKLCDSTGLTLEVLGDYKAYRQAVKDYAEDIREAGEKWSEAQNNEAIVRANGERLQNQEQINKDSVRFRKALHELQEKQLRIEEELEQVMRTGTLEEQMKALQELRKNVVQGSEAWKEYTNKIRSLKERMRDEEWQEAQRKSLEEQEKWLEETLKHFKAGSESAKKWERALRQVKDKALAEELKDLEKTFKVTGKYAEEDARTQAEIHKADLESLQARRAALEKMKAAPDVDAATLKAVNEKIKDTDKATKALRQGMKKAAAEAQKAVTNLKPLGKKAKAPNLQAPLKRAEKAYVELAKKAERQAANGDENGLARTQERMRRLAVDMERWMGYTGEAAKLQKETNDKLQKIRQDTAEVDRGLTYEQKQENQVMRALGENVRHRARVTKAAQKTAESAKDEADATQQAAKNARKNAQASKPTGQVNKAAQLNADVNGLRSQVQQLEAAQQQLNGNMGELSGAMGNLAAAAERTAALAGSMGSAAASALGRLEKKIASLEKQIDRINRKIS